jgi:hypothetical protein
VKRIGILFAIAALVVLVVVIHHLDLFGLLKRLHGGPGDHMPARRSITVLTL